MSVDILLDAAEEIKRLREIVQAVWDETGPYGGKIELCSKSNNLLRKHFKFDDGE